MDQSGKDNCAYQYRRNSELVCGARVMGIGDRALDRVMEALRGRESGDGNTGKGREGETDEVCIFSCGKGEGEAEGDTTEAAVGGCSSICCVSDTTLPIETAAPAQLAATGSGTSEAWVGAGPGRGNGRGMGWCGVIMLDEFHRPVVMFLLGLSKYSTVQHKV
ncbi:hypothetical protein M501DRAFT_986620 [Patellaria atrata CBS 101060]|uniref:Uncharacterized protein n=1 Tax=Patellaria atrata CBS 101060 TaxID=1346257 RepID=A0A9P4S923_9PEZI|nr:hypothetical protein M501DRAFT_986620 [Patellaria atrata CBS 101060]